MHLQTVTKYIRRSPYQSIAASLVMTLTFFAVSIFSLITIISIGVISHFESQPQLTIFFKDTAEQNMIDDLITQIEATEKTSTVTFVSKEEALQIYQEQNKDDPILLDLVTADILPASIEVQTIRPEYLAQIAEAVKDVSFIEEIIFQKDIVETLTSWTKALRSLGIGIITVLVFVSMFVILTIIGIKITVRREEIEIMKLIGASNWFIRTPFILEGMLYGFIGGFLGWLISVAILLYSTPTLESFLIGVPIFPLSPVILLELLVAQLLVAISLGAFASYLAVLRYLK